MSEKKRILNFGSLNIDHVYQVEHFVKPGETILSLDYQTFFGGKGFNQSVALSRADIDVYHAGKLGEDGASLLKECERFGINTKYILVEPKPSGHAIIQIDPSGENCILLFGGANQTVEKDYIDGVLNDFSFGDYLLIQNEISSLGYLIEQAHQKGLKIIFNPAPMNENVFTYPLEFIDVFILNEVEAFELSKTIQTEKALRALKEKYPKALSIITKGSKGVSYLKEKEMVNIPALAVEAIDTTAAGDTFAGYFLSALFKENSIEDAITLGIKAAALTVQKPGASNSIPALSELPS